MHTMQSIVEFTHALTWEQIPDSVRHDCIRSLLDLLGVAAAGTQTELSCIIRELAVEQFGAPNDSVKLLFDGRECSATGAALAGGMLIDSVDAHDGFKPAKGHVGCAVLPSLLAAVQVQKNISEHDFLTAFVVGYELGCRASMALHRTATDYHTSGAWVALTCAAITCRILKLTKRETEEALGIAEYHGPRSQMMRCIDHPTMVKDGSGWGAMAGTSAALLAQKGFTGAPAITMSADEVTDIWSNLGTHWHMSEQYIKLYPVCRWAQPAIQAALTLREQHSIHSDNIASIRIGTFHESARLATSIPLSSEQAQYSLPFPVAVALVHGEVGVKHIEGKGLKNKQVLKLSQMITLEEISGYDAEFPMRRISHIIVTMDNGETFESGPTEAPGDPENPVDDTTLHDKYHQLSVPVLGAERSDAILRCVLKMGRTKENPSLQPFLDLIHKPI